jgi:hypothetical protein
MTQASSPPGGWRGITQHVAFRALLRSILINMVAPSVLYRLAAPHYGTGSLIPLAISGLPPILSLAYSVIKLKAVDFLGLFAAEGVAVNIAALLLAHSEHGALIGRSLQNIPLALIFLGSLAFKRPLVFYMARQFATGNDPIAAQAFDRAADQPRDLNVYRVLTWVWTVALLVKCAGTVWLASVLLTKSYLVFSPLWDLVSDSALMSWSILYGRAKLAPERAAEASSAPLLQPKA